MGPPPPLERLDARLASKSALEYILLVVGIDGRCNEPVTFIRSWKVGFVEERLGQFADMIEVARIQLVVVKHPLG